MFHKVLIANRGEIAVRVARTLQQMGITAVAVYSDPDRNAPHVAAADEAYPLEGATSADTYLRGDRVLDLARRHGCQAIHPGYGFLSENEDFARACADSGVVFIGPSPDVVRAMGDKIVAKKAFTDAGVPVVPGWSGTGSEPLPAITAEAARIGYPVLIKAAAGGGGKGMRAVERAEELAGAVEAARREAAAAFGDGRVFLEKLIRHPRHVEVQIFGDHHGNVVHLFERECSIQRRHQKIVEESPSPALSPPLRSEITAAAVRAAQAIGYTNAGTVEFMLDDAGHYYFLEVNTRLQVEHPVTEMVTRRDLVAAQIMVAAGQKLPFTQDELRQEGCAMECRIYAEDADRGFLPSTGTISQFVPPAGGEIRVDSGVSAGSEVSVYYDPQLAKLIVWGATRNEALRRMRWALDRFVVLGVTTNIDFLRGLMAHPEFVAGRLHTQFLQEHKVLPPAPASDDDLLIAAAAALRSAGPVSAGASGTNHRAADYAGPWHAGTWRSA